MDEEAAFSELFTDDELEELRVIASALRGLTKDGRVIRGPEILLKAIDTPVRLKDLDREAAIEIYNLVKGTHQFWATTEWVDTEVTKSITAKIRNAFNCALDFRK